VPCVSQLVIKPATACLICCRTLGTYLVSRLSRSVLTGSSCRLRAAMTDYVGFAAFEGKLASKQTAEECNML